MRKKRKQQQKPEERKRYSEEAEKLLPAPLSSIQVQKKNALRFSLFVEDQFLIGVSDSTLTAFNLKKGVTITPSLFSKILQKEDEWSIREYFIRLLGRRDHARKELRDKALRKNYPVSSIESILNELEEKKYINNAAFAEKYACDKFEFNNWGVHKIRAELFKKGVNEGDIDQALAQFGEAELKETIVELIRKNKRKFQRAAPEKRKKKIFDYLLRKGYDSNNILKLMNTLLDIVKQ